MGATGVARAIDSFVDPSAPLPADATEAASAIQSALGNPPDLDCCQLQQGDVLWCLVHLDSLTDPQLIQSEVLLPLSQGRMPATSRNAQVRTYGEALAAILEGKLVALGGQQAFLVDVVKRPTRSPSEPAAEKVTTGPHRGFVENVDQNLGLIRMNLRDVRLRVERHTLHAATDVEVLLVYIAGLAPAETVSRLRRGILETRTSMAITDTSTLSEVFAPLQVVPLLQSTERPDRVAGALYEGRCAMMLEGSPTALLAPTVLLQLLQPVDDYYHRPQIASFRRTVRTIALILSVMLSALYTAAATINCELLPAPLFISISQARQNVPFPTAVEIFLMEGIIEIVQEAGLRVPGTLGQTASILGAVVVGQSAVASGIISAPTVVLSSLGFLASLAIPDLNASIGFRILRFPLIVIAAVFGIAGLALGTMLIGLHLAAMDSFGVSYLSPLTPFSWRAFVKSVLRLPLLRRSGRAEPGLDTG